MFKRLILFILSLALIAGLTSAVVLYGRGYRFDPKAKSISPTGILSVSSYPEKASIFINGKLTSATNASLTLAPEWYDIKISKEGYQSWEKRIRIQGEVVSQIDALLVPFNPSLRAITFTGVINPRLSPSGTKTAYLVKSSETDPATGRNLSGVWLLELRTGPLGTKPDPKQIFSMDPAILGSSADFPYENAELYWSYDEKELIVAFFPENPPPAVALEAERAFLLLTDNGVSTSPIEITSRYTQILAEWQEEKMIKDEANMASLPDAISRVLTTSTSSLRFSPDETKILYQATAGASLKPVIDPPLIGRNPTEETRSLNDGKFYIYDIKEDKNYYLADSQPRWYTDSKHLILVEKEKITVVDYDGTNKRSVYSGPFTDEFVFSWTSGGKIVILTNLNSSTSADFYEVDLR
ncbi:MAG: hypothetical protein UV73_C0006G0033 [Candidatus Gottesmanbacteria bacterium GW2011_GWA2_43_14]|uniref:PEGA domain-containing protein n=1 Tax=Candidatus Gottesmanbacteria bacterium GW2011_GWA2_43_14 TaxID=1618443 RepID=A0A0G1DJ31_9BACT|nr:MAG: hypothetical protein UV73_C0006G0033 [Candidatus Gottesmanbacteria bacterium GW2011_GWA2_43_14]